MLFRWLLVSKVVLHLRNSDGTYVADVELTWRHRLFDLCCDSIHTPGCKRVINAYIQQKSFADDHLVR